MRAIFASNIAGARPSRLSRAGVATLRFASKIAGLAAGICRIVQRRIGHARWVRLGVCLALALSTPAFADSDECTKRNRFGQCPDDSDEEYKGGAGFFMSVELSSLARAASTQASSVAEVTMVAAHVSMSFGSPHVRYFAALDLGVGAAFATEGLAYDVQLLPLGVGFELSRPEHTAFIGVATGIGASGAPGALPSAGMIPVQVSTMLRLSKGFNLLSRTRVSWLLNRTSRDNGSPTVPFADELDALLALQRSGEWNYLEGSYVGIAYRELEGARFIGVVFGKGGGEEVFDGYTNAEKEQRAQDRRSR